MRTVNAIKYNPEQRTAGKCVFCSTTGTHRVNIFENDKLVRTFLVCADHNDIV